MMNPGHALASTWMAHATNGRATGDHVVRNAARGLVLSTSSMLLWSVGMYPSRDNVWTNATQRVPGMNPETTPVLQTVMAMLAGGPYGPADLAGAMNKSLVMRSCRSDGVLLRADKPATLLDSTWARSFDDLQPRRVAAAFTELAGGLRWSYILAINLADPYAVSAEDLAGGSAANPKYVVCQFGTTCSSGPFVDLASTTTPLMVPARPQLDEMTPGWSFAVAAPILSSGWVLLGEVEKIVAVSGRRFRNVVATTSMPLQATVLAAVGETVEVAVLPAGERTRPIVVRCETTSAAPPRAPSLPAGEDPDVLLTLRCPTPSTCTCNAPADASVETRTWGMGRT